LLYVMTKNGEVRIWEYYNTLRTEGVEAPIVRGMAHDVTKRRQAELDLDSSEHRYRMLFEKTVAGVGIIGIGGKLIDCNDAWARMFGYSHATECFGIEMASCYANPAERETFVEELKQAGTLLNRELELQRKNGSRFWVLINSVLNTEEQSEPLIQSTMFDITARKEAEEAMRRNEERLAQEKLYLESEIQTELGFEEIIGQSAALREVLRKAKIVAPIDSTVLLLGESGTGKELVARAVHALSSRRDKNFIKLNCAAVPSGLLESELFGHERGAFTGAINQKIGRVELADKGTLFLDEIGELPLELQPKLLRLLQDREFERLGGVKTLRVDVRIVSATNRDLQKEVMARTFREDLFYRLNVFPIQLPTLRERRSDIPTLVHHFVRKHACMPSRAAIGQAIFASWRT
jgi:PAS domain S-box-containing protein